MHPVQGVWAFQRGLIYLREVQGQNPPNVAGPRLRVRFDEAGTGAAGALAKAMNQPDSDEIASRLQQDRRCFVAWYGDDIVSYCWVSLRHEYVGEMERALNLLEGEAYVWNCATLPQYRRRGLYTALLVFIQARLAANGIERIWIGADLENVPSHRAFDTAGFQPAAAFTLLRIWRLFGFLSTPPPGGSAARLPAARRLFRLDRLPSLGALSIGWRT